MVDRRRYVRHELAEGTVGVLASTGKPFMRAGPVTGISEAGVALRYAHGAAPPKLPLQLHLFGPNHSHLAMPALRCKIVFDMFSTVSVLGGPAGFCAIAFDRLSHRETAMLREFIRSLMVSTSEMHPEQVPCSIAPHVPVMDECGDCRSAGGQAAVAQTPLILLVDDDAMMLKLTRRVLEIQGYRVNANTCPKQALDFLRSNPSEVDLIITDYWMPPMTGAEFAQEALRVLPDVPIILFTGSFDVLTDQKARDSGFRKLALKPLEKDELIKIVESVLDQDRANAMARAFGRTG